MEVFNSDKKQSWDDMMVRVCKTEDGLGEPIDDGIKEMVTVLNLLGFNTTGSCEGHLEVNPDCVSYAPWVNIETRESLKASGVGNDEKTWAVRGEMERQNLEKRKRLLNYLNEFYQNRNTEHQFRIIVFRLGWGSRIESLGAPLQLIEAEEERKRKLAIYQKEMENFKEFLKRKYFEN